MGIKLTHLSFLVVALSVCGCSVQSNDYDINAGKAFFAAHRNELENVVKEVSKCKGYGVVSIYSDGKINRQPPPSPSCPDFSDIAANIHKMGIMWVNVSGNLPYGKLGPMAATFVLSSRGIIPGGYGSAIYYFPDKEDDPFGDSIPLDGKPGHWFFRRL